MPSYFSELLFEAAHALKSRKVTIFLFLGRTSLFTEKWLWLVDYLEKWIIFIKKFILKKVVKMLRIYHFSLKNLFIYLFF